jgi:glycosyltransferase involved in cell wall biosynthesis
MVGDGPERYGLEELCTQLGLCDRVVFIGKVRETQEVLEISDLFVLPSETESFGLAALEAMAMGVPVISSNTGGIPEVNINGETGFMSEVGDVEDMAKNAIYILEDEDRKKRFGENALARSIEIYNSKTSLYRAILNPFLIIFLDCGLSAFKAGLVWFIWIK